MPTFRAINIPTFRGIKSSGLNLFSHLKVAKTQKDSKKPRKIKYFKKKICGIRENDHLI